jgi:outer membrane biosynthesis protein TonB
MSAVDKEGMIEYPFSYQTVFRAAVQSIPLVKGMKMGRADEMNGYILITSNISWASWGENIRVDFVKLGPTRTQMIVKSGASVSTTLIDYGKNRKNVNKILSAVSTTLANYPPETAYNDTAQPVPEINPQFGQMPPQPQQAYEQPPQPQQAYQQPPQPQQAYEQPPQPPQQAYEQSPQPQQQAYQQPPQPPQQAYQQPPQPQQQAYQQPQHQPYQAQQQGYQQPRTPMRPENNMLWGILCTVFCCLPLGIIAIVFSNKVNTLYDSGDYSGAQEAADNAKKYAVMGAICGLVFIGIAFILFVLSNL